MRSRCLFVLLLTLNLDFTFAMGGGGAGAVMAKKRHREACESLAANSTCPPQQKIISRGVIDSMKVSCEMIQKNDGCDELRAEIAKSSSAGEASKKIQGCDDKSVCKQSLDWEGMQTQCLEGIQKFGKEAMDKVIKAGQAIANSAIETNKCDKNIDGRKQKLYDDYNATVPETLNDLKIYPPKGRWMEEATCGEIMQKLSGMSQNILKLYTNKMMAFEQQNPKARGDINLYTDPTLKAYKQWFTQNGEKETAEMNAKIMAIGEVFTAIPALLKQLNVKLNCYNDATRAEVVCHAATALVASAVSGMAGTAATKALMSLARSSGSLKVAQAVSAMEKLKKEEGKLAEVTEASAKAKIAAANGSGTMKAAAKAEDRIATQTTKVATQNEKVLKKMDGMRGEKGDLQRQQVVKAMGVIEAKSPEQQEKMLKAVVDAHNVCAESGFKQYSTDCLRKKSKILKSAGYEPKEREFLMRNGIAGKYADGTDGFPFSETKNVVKASGSQLDGKSSIVQVMMGDGKLLELQVVGTKTEGGVIKHTVRNAKNQTSEISEADLLKRSISPEAKPVQVRGSAYEGKSELLLVKDGVPTTLVITGSEVVEGKIVHNVVYEAGGFKMGRKLTEEQMKDLKITAKPNVQSAKPATLAEAAETNDYPAATSATRNSETAAGGTNRDSVGESPKVGNSGGSELAGSTRSPGGYTGSGSSPSSGGFTSTASKPRTWSEKVEASADPKYVNEYGFARKNMVRGAPVKVNVHTMEGLKNLDAEIDDGVFFNEFTKTWQVNVKYQKGLNTTPGHPMRGKPEYGYQTVDIVEIDKGVPKPALPKSETSGVTRAPLDQNIVKPKGDAVYNPAKDYDDQHYDFFRIRKDMDSQAASILENRRIGERYHIETLREEINEDGWIRNQVKKDGGTVQTSKLGRFSDPRFDPKIYYAQLKEDAFAGDSAAKDALNGQYRHDIDNGAKLHGGAKDKIRDHIIAQGKKAGKSDEQVAKELGELNNWMNQYDRTVPRHANYEKAKAAQAQFETSKSELIQAAKEGKNKALISQERFESMAKNLEDMMLKKEDREAAELALRKIRCSRPEWNLKNKLSFNLKCD